MHNNVLLQSREQEQERAKSTRISHTKGEYLTAKAGRQIDKELQVSTRQLIHDDKQGGQIQKRESRKGG